MILIGCALTFTGCRSSPEKPAAQPRTRTITVQTNDFSRAGGKVIARPVDALNGRVISVNEPLRFVIVDFPNQKMPRLEQKLLVYRIEQKVAELKVSGPYRGTTVAADITAGEARYGDLVRDER